MTPDNGVELLALSVRDVVVEAKRLKAFPVRLAPRPS